MGALAGCLTSPSAPPSVRCASQSCQQTVRSIFAAGTSRQGHFQHSRDWPAQCGRELGGSLRDPRGRNSREGRVGDTQQILFDKMFKANGTDTMIKY